MSDPSKTIESFSVPDEASGRLSDFAVGKFESLPSRKSVKKAIKRGLLLVNGNTSETGHWVVSGEVLSVIADAKTRPVYARSVDVIYEDDYLAAVQKPADLPVSGNAFRTLQNALSFNLKRSSQKDALPVPRPVHRLDRLTGGVVLIAKTYSAAAHLGSQFEKRVIQKSYLAWVSGEIATQRSLENPVEGKAAATTIKPIQTINYRRFSKLTLVEANPVTGRRNQIRIHLAEAGHPILGDLKFGGAKSGKGLFLFAKTISFSHPISNTMMQVDALVPKKFQLNP